MFEKIILFLQSIKYDFRKDCRVTSRFGLTNRYKYIDGKQVWGYPGIHPGTDVAGSNQEIIAPFSFYKSNFKDFGGKGYGSLLQLNHKLGFCVRIAHIYPHEVRVENGPVKAGTLLGLAGSYGNSTGRHTHTEIEAWGRGKWLDKCDFLESILKKKYGNLSLRAYTQQEIIELYKSCNCTHFWDASKCLDDFNKIKKQNKIEFINKYKIIYQRGNRFTTFYSSKHLFDF